MIKRLFIFTLVILSHILYAQKDSNKNSKRSSIFLSLNMGLSDPTNGLYINAPGTVGCFGSYADLGYNINLLGGIKIHNSHWGICGAVMYNTQQFDIQECFLTLGPWGDNGKLVSSSSSNFKETCLMAGGFFSTKRKPALEIRVLVGDNICTLAGYSLMGTVTSVTRQGGIFPVLSSLQSANSSSIAYDFGASLHFIENLHLYGIFTCDFIYSQAYFNTSYSENIYISNYTWLIGSDHLQVTYNILNFTIGIGYKF